MGETAIGIDLGTTNSVVATTDEFGMTLAIAGEDGHRVVPSVVYFQDAGDPVVGSVAKDNAVLEPGRVAQLFKRGMGRRTFLDDESDFVVDGKIWSPQELSALVLKKLKQTAEAHLGRPVNKAIVTVPAYFGFDERQATETAGEIAGLDVLQLLNEPTAAAIAHSLEAESMGKVLVFDLGGGTFDVTIMEVAAGGRIEVLSTTGDHRLGGADFDNLIIARMVDAVRDANGFDLASDPYAMQDARSRAEQLKIDLSTKDTATKPLAVGGRPVKFTLTVSEFDEMLADHLVAIRDHVELALDEARVRAADLTTALMVGGSSRIRCMQRTLSEILGKEPRLSKNLDEDVARGAAMLAVKLLDEQRPQDGLLDSRSALKAMPKPQDIVTHALARRFHGVTV